MSTFTGHPAAEQSGPFEVSLRGSAGSGPTTVGRVDAEGSPRAGPVPSGAAGSEDSPCRKSVLRLSPPSGAWTPSDEPASAPGRCPPSHSGTSSDKMDNMLTAGTDDSDTRPLAVTRRAPAEVPGPRSTDEPSLLPPAPSLPHNVTTKTKWWLFQPRSCALFGGRGYVRQQETLGQNYHAKFSH